jgi:PKD repeat protein
LLFYSTFNHNNFMKKMLKKFQIIGLLFAILTLVGSCAKDEPKPLPVAEFSFSQSGSIVPVNVSFTNASTNAKTYSWDFGNGQSSTQANPSTTYGTAGTYTITLTATGDGGTHSVSKTISVSKPAAPVADFTFSPSSIIAGGTVAFVNRSTNAKSFSWNFVTTASTLENPSITFANPGTFNITLTVAGDGGQSSVTKTLVVSAPAVAGFLTEPRAPGTGAIVSNRTNVKFSYNQTGAVSWLYDFGDGTTSTERDPVHQFKKAGEITVTLTVRGAGGDVKTATDKFLVGAQVLLAADRPNDDISQQWLITSAGRNIISVKYAMPFDTNVGGLSYLYPNYNNLTNANQKFDIRAITPTVGLIVANINRFLTLDGGGGINNGAGGLYWSPNIDANNTQQQFSFTHIGNGYYYIQHVRSGLWLTAQY